MTSPRPVPSDLAPSDTSAPALGTVSFADAIALGGPSKGPFDAMIVAGWDVRGVPHGGYLLALVGAAACRASGRPDPISVAATFLSPPRFGPATLTVEPVRTGRRQVTATVIVAQDDTPLVHATVTTGDLGSADAEALVDDAQPPPLPAPERCVGLAALTRAEGEAIALHERLELRLGPEVGWVRDAPTGVPRIDGWLRLADGAAPDPLSLLLFSDGFPPSVFEAVGSTGSHVPTVQLTTHLFARPERGWVQGRFVTRVRGGGFVDEDGDLWDSGGRLVATTRQLALLRR